MLKAAARDDDQPSESECVLLRRYLEAREAGLTMDEAHLFAESDTDIGLLRKLVAGGCNSSLTAKILC